MKGRYLTLVIVMALLLIGGCSSPATSIADLQQTSEIIGDASALPETAAAEILPDIGPVQGEFLLLTYNVAGLPKEISDEKPEINNAKISPLLNDFDLVLVQEDFAYHGDLSAEVTLPYQSAPLLITETMSDGLNRFARFPFPPVERLTWEVCSGIFDKANDCLTAKGFSVTEMVLAPDVEIFVYNLHMDAGGDTEDRAARAAQVDQLLADIAARTEGRALLIAGDTNLRMERPEDQASLDKLLQEASLDDACRSLECGDERIDRVLFRSSETLNLTPTTWSIPGNFIDEDGEPLSDHDPVAVRFGWTSD